jgi:hypothetical protein
MPWGRQADRRDQATLRINSTDRTNTTTHQTACLCLSVLRYTAHDHCHTGSRICTSGTARLNGRLNYHEQQFHPQKCDGRGLLLCVQYLVEILLQRRKIIRNNLHQNQNPNETRRHHINTHPNGDQQQAPPLYFPHSPSVSPAVSYINDC